MLARYIGQSTRYSQYSFCPNTLSAIFFIFRYAYLYCPENSHLNGKCHNLDGDFLRNQWCFFYTGIKVLLSTCLCQKGLPFNIARIVRMLLFSVTLYCQVTLIVVNVNNCWTLWMWMWNVLIGSNFIRTSTDKRNIMATNRIIQSQIGKDKWKQKSSGVENEIKRFKRICKLDWRGSHYHIHSLRSHCCYERKKLESKIHVKVIWTG